MQIPHTYFEDEVREGFYIPGIVKRAWAAQIEVLEVLDRICKKHNIKWFADCGTLLGAVRHGGYIPWDDDLDICMLRPDYIRFNNIIRKEMPEGYVILNLNNEGEDMYFEHLTRITNSHRVYFDGEFLEKYHQFPYAAGIDIFPIDYIAEDEEEEEQRKELIAGVMSVAENMADDDSNIDEFRDDIADIEKICVTKINYNENVKRQLYQIAERLFALYSDVGGEYVALMPYWVHKNNHKYPAKLFDKTIMLPFEYIQIPAPAAYDAVLRIEYGDYMTIYKNGGVHGYPFFVNQEEFLMEQINSYPFKYKFSMDHLENDIRKEYKSPRKQAQEFLSLMLYAHGSLIKLIEEGRYDEATDLLTSCQNSAIQIGTLLEDRYGEGFATVGVLEQYCEVIYEVYGMIRQVEDNSENFIDTNDLRQFLADVAALYSNSINNDIPKRKEILFIGAKADAWKAFDSIYRAACADPECDVYVMPVPYYMRNALGAKMDRYYEKDLFPDDLNLVDYSEYNIKKKHPDIIFIQNPYDQCNYTTCLESDYFSSNLKGYTEKLVYVPWFKLDEIESDNHKARRIMEFYCNVPGLVHSDVVVVQSENMKKEYVRCLTKFAGDDTKNIWEEKILSLGSPVDDEADNMSESSDRKKYLERLPESWTRVIVKEDGELKKILVYNTTVSSAIEHGRDALKKIKSSLDVFKNNSDNVALIWRPHPMLMQAFKSQSKELAKEYSDLVYKYRISGWGVYDDTQDTDAALKLSDAYYGDADILARNFEYMGKPVMIQDVKVM